MGAVLGQTGDGRIFIREVPENLAADKSGLKAGDEIILVDGRDVRPLNAKQLNEALTGEVGAPLKLTVVRGQEVLRVTLRLTPAQKHRVDGAPAGKAE